MKPCLRCGKLTRDGSYCRAHRPARIASLSSLDRPSPRLCSKVKARDGNRCTRCGSTEHLEVHHQRAVPTAGRTTKQTS